MMKKNSFSLNGEKVLYGLILIIGLALRLIQLGKLPLSDEEARLALQAFGLASGESSPFFNPDGGYLITTTGLFFIFSKSEFLARLIPALAGTLICLIPLAFQRFLGRKTALIAAFGLALDGGWLAASRQAGSHTWAVLFLLAVIWAVSSRRWKVAGIFSGLLLLGGVEVWKGLIPLGVAIGVYNLWFRWESFAWNDVWLSFRNNWKEFLTWAVGALLVLGSLFLILPTGWSAMGGGLISYLRGWNNPSGVSVGMILTAMLIYQPISTLFGLIASLRQIKKSVSLELFLTIWSFFALIHCFLYPAREVLDVLWVSLPLLGLAARLLSSLLRFNFDQRIAALIYGVVVLIFLMFTSQNIMRLFSPGRVAVNTQPEIIAILAALLFVIISVILIGWGWSTRVAGYGVTWGLLVWLMLFWLSGSFHAAGLGENPETNPFRRGWFISEADLLKDTIGDLSELNVRSRTGLDVMAIGLDQPAMRWFAREFTNFKFENTFQPQIQSSIVLTGSSEGVVFGENYRGQDFHWQVQPIWDLMTAKEWMQWAIFKIAPLENKMIFLWARESLFPGSEISNEVQP